jgi:NAD(P)-dependent dehydrogenase (short-subunit alcohol dehydrogenase family)
MSVSISLTGKTALVTGGGRGIGKAIAKHFAQAGANVVIASRKLPNLRATAEELSGLPGKIVPIECHVGRLDQLQNLVRETEARLGPVDILVNNSATNIGNGPALDGGAIINIASISGLHPQPEGLLYSFTKAGLIMLTRCWAREFGQHNIRVNAIAPGLIQTDFSEYFWKDETRRRQFETRQPIARIGQPDELGHLALYLASSESSYVTGQVFVADGGATA